jgi:hypothetical protein
VWAVWGVCGVWGVGCGWCGGVGSLLTFDIPQTALVATLDTYDFIFYHHCSEGRGIFTIGKFKILKCSKQTRPCVLFPQQSTLVVVENAISKWTAAGWPGQRQETLDLRYLCYYVTI